MDEKENIRFVAAKAGDFEYFYTLRRTTMFEHYVRAGLDWPEETEFARHRKTFDENLSFLRMIHRGERRIGFIKVRFESDAIAIGLFCIEPEHQKQGIGTRVMDMILAEPEVSSRELRLDVLHSNHAAHLYERMGFTRMSSDDLLHYYVRPPRSKMCAI